MYDIVPKRSDSIFILLIGMLFHSCDFCYPPEESAHPKPCTKHQRYDKFEQDWTNEDRQAYLESLGNTQDWASPEDRLRLGKDQARECLSLRSACTIFVPFTKGSGV